MKIVGNDRNSDCLSINITIFALEGIYLTNNNNQTKTKTKQKRERQKEKRKATSRRREEKQNREEGELGAKM